MQILSAFVEKYIKKINIAEKTEITPTDPDESQNDMKKSRAFYFRAAFSKKY